MNAHARFKDPAAHRRLFEHHAGTYFATVGEADRWIQVTSPPGFVWKATGEHVLYCFHTSEANGKPFQTKTEARRRLVEQMDEGLTPCAPPWPAECHCPHCLADAAHVPAIQYHPGIRHQARDTTPNRLARARAALARERDKLALFADQVAADQPTPEERLATIERDQVDFWKDHRNARARDWRNGRRWLRALPRGVQARIVEKWNRQRGPKDGTYFATFVRMAYGRLGLPFPESDTA